MQISRPIRALAARSALLLVAGAIAALPLAAQRRDTAITSVESADAALRTGGAVRVANIARLDVALAPHRWTWARLSTSQRREIDEAFDALLPGERMNRYRLNDAQARAIVFLAFGERCDGNGRSCAAAAVRVSSDALWIRDAVIPLRRAVRVRLSRDRELAVLVDVEARARSILLALARCDCSPARDRAEELREASRVALQRHRASSDQAWRSVGDDRLAQIQALASNLSREAARCRQ